MYLALFPTIRPFLRLFMNKFHIVRSHKALHDSFDLERRNGRNDDSGGSSSGNSSWVSSRTNVEKIGAENGEGGGYSRRSKTNVQNAHGRKTGRATYTNDTGSRGEVKGRAPTGQ